MGSSVILPPPGQPAKGPQPGFTTGSLPNVSTFTFKEVAPPSPLYIQRDDQLGIRAFTQISSGDIVTITARLLLAPFNRTGQPDVKPTLDPGADPQASNLITQVTLTLQVAAGGTSFYGNVTSLLQALSEGYLLGIAAVSSNASRRGQTFVSVFLNRGQSGFNITGASQPLFSDWVVGVNVTGWPGGRIVNSSESTGLLQAVAVTNPGAGADWSFTIPSNARMRISSFFAVLTTSAVAGNRIVRVQILQGSFLVWQAAAGIVIPASTACSVAGAPGQSPTATDPTTANLALPDPCILNSNGTPSRLNVNTAGILGGDQWTAIAIHFELWADNT